MAYVDQNQSKEKTVALVITLIIMLGVGYAFVTGLAYNVIKKAATRLNVVDIQQPPPPPPPVPPPPPKETPKVQAPPPPTSPPPLVKSVAPPPPIATVQTLTPPPPAPPTLAPPAPTPAPPAPKPSLASSGHPRGNLGDLMSTDDYPPSALRDQEQGTVGFTLTYDAGGRVSNCQVTSSSGHGDLDDTSCKLLTRRARFVPGKDTAGNAVGGTYQGRFTWVVPKD